MKEGGNPSVRCGGQPPLHASAASGLRRGSRRKGQPLSPLRRTAPLTQRSRGQPLSLLRQPAPLTQGSRGRPLSLLRQTAPLTQGSRRRGQPLSPLRRTAPLTCFSRKRPAKGGAEGRDNPSVCCGRQLLLHASAASGLRRGSRRRGQPLSLLRQTAPLTFFAPTQLFELRRCCGRLIFRKEYTVLFSPKRSTFSRKRPAKGEPKEGTTPQFAAADSSPV